MGVLAGALTPNLHIYHSHIDVHPPEEDKPNAWRWHEDGGRQTADLDYRARLSAKLGYWLSDCDEPGMGNLEVIPGSNHWTEFLPRTPGQTPEGAIQVLAKAGDVTLFERRIWHGRSTNLSERTRMVVFFGYSPRWIVQREFPSAEQLQAAIGDPLRRQLIGAPDWDSCHVGAPSSRSRSTSRPPDPFGLSGWVHAPSRREGACALPRGGACAAPKQAA